MTLLYPIALIAGISIPILIFIYFFHRSLHPKSVSAIFLWPRINVKAGKGLKITDLIKNLLLLLEILILVFLITAGTGPHLRNKKKVYKIVFVLDNSASMGAKSSGSKSRDRAVSKIIKYMENKKPYSIDLIQTGFTPRILDSSIKNTKKLKNTLKMWQPEEISHEITPSLNLAKQIIGNDGYIIIISDQKPGNNILEQIEIDKRLIWWSFGKFINNIGITQANRKRDENGEHIFVILQNFGKKDKTVKIKINIDNKEIKEIQKILKKDGYIEPLSLILDKTEKPIEIELETNDGLEIDNKILLVQNNKPVIPVQLIINSKSADKLIKKTLDIFEDSIKYTDKNPLLIITDQPFDIKKLNIEKNSIWIIEFKLSSGKNYYGPYIIDKNNDFTRELILDGVRWPAGGNIKNGFPIISIGDMPVAVEKNILEEHIKYYIFDIGLADSNIDKTLNWPILWSNIINSRKNDLSGIPYNNVKLGNTIIGKYINIEKLYLQGSNGDIKEIQKKNDYYPIYADKKDIIKIYSDKSSYEFVSYIFLSESESDLRKAESGEWKSTSEKEKTKNPYLMDISWIFFILILLIFIIHSYFLKQGAI